MSLTHQLSICLSVGSFVRLTGTAPKEPSHRLTFKCALKVLNELICMCLLETLLLESLNEEGGNMFSQDFALSCFLRPSLTLKC